ncbi:hypothetical protein NPIL_78581 [Nephila pilipes]|uniref:Uncharacterized protein n=1 Tax=Nephila pilipes TaxID=299642 RepID=A0A8X6U8J2_NEPPI|nr:hypothetical protein NPIL_78581 [Nephila pilipes]
MQILVIKGCVASLSPHPIDDRLQQMVCATLSHCVLTLSEGRNDRSWCVAAAVRCPLRCGFTAIGSCIGNGFPGIFPHR